MTAEDLISLIREDLDDINKPYLWSDDYLLAALNRAERRACCSGNMEWIFDDSTASVCQITLSGTVASYTLSKKILLIESIFLDGSQLTQKNREELDRTDAVWRIETGTPTEYIQNGYSLRMRPIPVVTGTVSIECYRLPLNDMTVIDEPELHEADHESLRYWVEYEAWSQQDADKHNPVGAGNALAMFAAHFGEYNDADVRRHLLDSQKTLTLRGTPYQNFASAPAEDDDW